METKEENNMNAANLKTLITYGIRKIRSEDKILKYHLKPVTLGFFIGIQDSNKMSFLTRKSIEVGYKSQFQNNEFKEIESGVYDLRNWDAARS